MNIAIDLLLLLFGIASLGIAWDIAKEDLFVSLIAMLAAIAFLTASVSDVFAT